MDEHKQCTICRQHIHMENVGTKSVSLLRVQAKAREH